jgi:sarcosine oxidase
MKTAEGSAYDVIVVGLGGMGSAAAYHLARRGQRVLGLERFTPAHDRGSSHGGSRIIRQAYFEDPGYVPLVLRAYELWAELEREAGDELLTITGGLVLGPPDGATVTGARHSAEQWGLPHEILDGATVRRRFPTLAPDDDTVAVYEPKAGVLRPEATVNAHLRLGQASGAALHFLEPVTAWHAGVSGDGVSVVTNQATYRADRLVICPGAWAPALLEDLGIPFVVERLLQTWYQPDGGVEPFLPRQHPVWLWEPAESTDSAGYAGFAYGVPAMDGPDGGVKMCVIFNGGTCSADNIERTVTRAEQEAVASHLSGLLASGPGRLLRAGTCMITNTSDHHFVVTRHPRHPQVTVAGGCSGHGFKFVPVIGEILADLVIDGKTPHPIALFDPSRLTKGGMTRLPAGS